MTLATVLMRGRTCWRSVLLSAAVSDDDWSGQLQQQQPSAEAEVIQSPVAGHAVLEEKVRPESVGLPAARARRYRYR